ncbi:baseplate J/gp47 family protein [Brevibacillus laterosporus]|uniref:baseplate J/gp47 family protein n=1 Tax=Brevibacillus laterosporus TaxID=1465 RepID=UPI003D222C50
MAALEKPEMPILRETPDEIYQRIANRMTAYAIEQEGQPPAVEEGEIFYDLEYPLAEEISDQQRLLEYAFLQAFLPWADGEFLEGIGIFFGLNRGTGESDEPFRERILDRARTEEGTGRPSDYVRWARNIDGVGGAMGVEKARHDLSMDVYITDVNGQPVTEEFAKQVRNKMEDKRIGLHDLQVLSATIYEVKISVTLFLRSGTDIKDVRGEIDKQIRTYIKGRSKIMYQQIGALFFVDGVEDFTHFTLNGGTDNLQIPVSSVALVQLEVTV